MESFNPKKMENLSPDKKALRVYLSETTVDYVEQWQALNNVSNRSKAIEGLILMSIRDARMLGISAIFQDTIRRTMNAQFNRFAKLIAASSLEAGAAKEASQSIFWWILLQEFGGYLEDLKPDEAPTVKGFERVFSIDPNSEEGRVLIAFFKNRNARFRHRAVKQLRRPIGELLDLLADEEEGEESE